MLFGSYPVLYNIAQACIKKEIPFPLQVNWKDPPPWAVPSCRPNIFVWGWGGGAWALRTPKETKCKNKWRLNEFKVFVKQWQTTNCVQKRESNVNRHRQMQIFLPNTSNFTEWFVFNFFWWWWWWWWAGGGAVWILFWRGLEDLCTRLTTPTKHHS